MNYYIELYHGTEESREATRLNIENKLLQEILGYSQEEANYINHKDESCIAVDLTPEQTLKIILPFIDNNINAWAYDSKERDSVGLLYIPGYDKKRDKTPKNHYYDQPVVGKEHLPDIYAEEPPIPIRTEPIFEQNVPKCPTCQSTNVKKISGGRRWLTTGLFGIASSDMGKTMECKNCGYKW